jgi:hypothetical protein
MAVGAAAARVARAETKMVEAFILNVVGFGFFFVERSQRVTERLKEENYLERAQLKVFNWV